MLQYLRPAAVSSDSSNSARYAATSAYWRGGLSSDSWGKDVAHVRMISSTRFVSPERSVHKAGRLSIKTFSWAASLISFRWRSGPSWRSRAACFMSWKSLSSSASCSGRLAALRSKRPTCRAPKSFITCTGVFIPGKRLKVVRRISFLATTSSRAASRSSKLGPPSIRTAHCERYGV